MFKLNFFTDETKSPHTFSILFDFFEFFVYVPMVMRLGLVLEASNKEPTPGGLTFTF